MVTKRIPCSDRLRRIPRQFSWIDHRLVRDNHLCAVSHSSLALYLFLVTVSDADGLSYYSDVSIKKHLNLTPLMTGQARAELCAAGLIAYSKPIYQVLSLDEKSQAPKEVVMYDMASNTRSKSDLAALGDILRRATGGVQ